MRGNELLDKMELVDPVYVEAADTKRIVKKQSWRKWASIAACFTLAVVLVVGAFRGERSVSSEDVATLSNGETITFVKAEYVKTASQLVSTVERRTLNKEEKEAVFADLPVTASVYFEVEQNQLMGFMGHIKDMELVVTTPGMRLDDTIVEGIEEKTVVDGIPVTAGYFLTEANSKGEKTAIYYASLEFSDCTVYIENVGAENDSENVKNELAEVIYQFIQSAPLDFSQIQESIEVSDDTKSNG